MLRSGVVIFILGCIFEAVAILSVVTGKGAGISAKGTHPSIIIFADKPIEFSIVLGFTIWVGYLFIKNGYKKMKGRDSM